MPEFEDDAVVQHTATQCVAATIASVIRHFCSRRGLEHYPSLSDVNDYVKPLPHIDYDSKDLIHDENPEDILNMELFSSSPVHVETGINMEYGELVEIVEEDRSSYPIVTLHPEYMEKQPGINTDGESVVRHQVVVLEADDQGVKIWDPILKRPNVDEYEFKEDFSRNEFMELWSSIVDKPLNDPTPQYCMWLVERQAEPGQEMLG